MARTISGSSFSTSPLTIPLTPSIFSHSSRTVGCRKVLSANQQRNPALLDTISAMDLHSGQYIRYVETSTASGW